LKLGKKSRRLLMLHLIVPVTLSVRPRLQVRLLLDISA
jgi:hypothetical protein